MISVYDLNKTYEYNFYNGPFFHPKDGDLKYNIFPTTLFDYELNNPVGIGAGILLNSNWVKLYSDLGYSVLTYKTVRAYKKQSLEFPNCRFVNIDSMGYILSSIPSNKNITITNHLGIPSMDPEFWIEDVNKSVELLKPGQILILSIYGETERELLTCANLATTTYAHIIEINLSCPNVDSKINISRRLFSKLREIIDVPLLIKLGTDFIYEDVESIIPYIDGISLINSIRKGDLSLCGHILYPELLKTIGKIKNFNLPILAMGGLNSINRVKEILSIADIAMLVTSAIFKPQLNNYF